MRFRAWRRKVFSVVALPCFLLARFTAPLRQHTGGSSSWSIQPRLHLPRKPTSVQARRLMLVLGLVLLLVLRVAATRAHPVSGLLRLLAERLVLRARRLLRRGGRRARQAKHNNNNNNHNLSLIHI